jgi:hypothetical protein
METFLPLNLRGFLTAELGAKINIDDNVISPVAPDSNESFLRELARAIRRFSFQRAHESWTETVVPADALEEAMAEASAGRCQVVLCLRCETVTLGPMAARQHAGASCFPIPLHQAMARAEAGELTGPAVRHLLYQMIESFRQERTSSGLPHFDLDHYVRGSQMVFTWRPLPPP